MWKSIYLFFFSYFIDDNDNEEIHNNPNLHSEEQDGFEIPDG